MKRVRIKDIAEKAGVSIGTVDRVLHNRGEVKEDTKERILKIAKEMKYSPNLAAQILKSPTTYKVGILLPLCRGDNNFWNLHPVGIEKAVQDAHPFNIETVFFRYEMYNGEDFREKADQIVQFAPDGVVFAPIMKKESMHLCKLLDGKEIPYVFIDTFISDMNNLAFIGEDAYQSGRVSASLIDIGIDQQSDVLIINIAKNLENIEHLNKRNQGFLSYFMDAGNNNGLKISLEISSTEETEVKQALDKVLNNNPNVKAILVSSSRTYAIANYLKLSERTDIFLVGYEVFGKNIEYLKKKVITFLIGQKPIEQGEKAIKKLFDFLNTKTIPEKKEYQAIEIINLENLNHFR